MSLLFPTVTYWSRDMSRAVQREMKSMRRQIFRKTTYRCKHNGRLISIATDRMFAWRRWHLHAPHVEGMPREFADRTETHGLEPTFGDQYVAFRSNNTDGVLIGNMFSWLLIKAVCGVIAHRAKILIGISMSYICGECKLDSTCYSRTTK